VIAAKSRGGAASVRCLRRRPGPLLISVSTTSGRTRGPVGWPGARRLPRPPPSSQAGPPESCAGQSVSRLIVYDPNPNRHRAPHHDCRSRSGGALDHQRSAQHSARSCIPTSPRCPLCARRASRPQNHCRRPRRRQPLDRRDAQENVHACCMGVPSYVGERLCTMTIQGRPVAGGSRLPSKPTALNCAIKPYRPPMAVTYWFNAGSIPGDPGWPAANPSPADVDSPAPRSSLF